MRNLRFGIVAVVMVITIALGIQTTKVWPPSETATDFYVYYTAAQLVRKHMSSHMYDEADRNINPQLKFANPNTVYARTANSYGISEVQFYLYPPTLADLMLPLTALPPFSAFLVWTVLGFLLILPLSAVTTEMLDLNFMGAGGVVAAFTLLFRPTLGTVHWGEVSILLTFAVVLGFWLYVKGHTNAAAFLFALAIAIKLVPLIVIVPLIAWRDWKTFRSVVAWCAVLLVGVWAVNGSRALDLFFLHQLPAMSAGDLGSRQFSGNRALGNIFYTFLAGNHPVLGFHAIAWIVRLVSALILAYAGWLSRPPRREKATRRQQFEVGMMFLLLACAISPYSWLHAWVLSVPAIVIFCQEAWEGHADALETVLLVAFLLSLVTSRYHVAMLTPVFAIALGIYALRRLRAEYGVVQRREGTLRPSPARFRAA